MTAAPLSERIEQRRQDDLSPLAERRGGSERRLPTWMQRMQDGQLPAKDLTATGRAA